MKSGKGTITTIAAIAALSGATAAAAAGNWDGPYWGANAGYAWGKSDVSMTTVFSPTGYFAASSVPAIATASGGHINADGFNGGFNLGYNQQSGNMVYGAEIDLDAMDINDSRTGGATYPCCAPTSFSNRQTVKADWLLTARGRLGYAADRSLFYVTGGLAATTLKVSNHFTDTFATANESSSASKTKYGWVLGLGYEYAMENKWSLKAEYLHAHFDRVSSTSNNLTAFGPAVAFPSNTFNNRGNLQLDMIRIGFNKQF